MPETLTICGCCKGEDGIWRFVCKCGFQSQVWRESPGCPKCGVLWEFEKAEVKAA